MIGHDKDFRPGQWEAIGIVAVKKQRALIVQRTGWGKSLVYFLATKLLREQGAGPTLLISPLLSLMRNQIEMASRIGIRAYTINSTNKAEWASVEDALRKDECDLMLISPERLNNEHFLKKSSLKFQGGSVCLSWMKRTVSPTGVTIFVLIIAALSALSRCCPKECPFWEPQPLPMTGWLPMWQRN